MAFSYTRDTITFMNKKVISLFLLIGLLSACKSDVLPLKYTPYQYLENPQTTFIKSSGDIYYRNDEVMPLVLKDIEGVNIKTGITSYSSLNDVSLGFDTNNYSLVSNDVDFPNSIIEQNLLVAPVYFTDSSVATSDELKQEKLTLLENAFFGDEKYTNYQSVASYYNKSSYGHLKIKGEVLPWVSISQSSSEAYQEGKNSPENYSDKIAKMVVESLDEETFNKYSKNNEGVLDSLYLIYDYPYQNDKKNNEDSLFWAYTYHCKTSNKVSVYSWSSFDFVGSKALNKHIVDASTYIHETGHLFGLLDYYNKGSLTSYQPMGFMDMMDYNLGDHSPLSKYLLNWTSPYVLNMGDKSSGSITIKSFSESGEFILVPRSDYNGTAYDRYLLISFFSPKGLNDLSDFPSYEYINESGKKSVFTYPNKYGVLVYEVNAKLGYFKSGTIRSFTPTCFVDETPASGDYVINFYYDNEINNSNDKPLYHLLESSGQNTFKEGGCASNETLFKYNSTFGIKTFEDLASEFGVTFKVSQLTVNQATITFNKK